MGLKDEVDIVRGRKEGRRGELVEALIDSIGSEPRQTEIDRPRLKISVYLFAVYPPWHTNVSRRYIAQPYDNQVIFWSPNILRMLIANDFTRSFPVYERRLMLLVKTPHSNLSIPSSPTYTEHVSACLISCDLLSASEWRSPSPSIRSDGLEKAQVPCVEKVSKDVSRSYLVSPRYVFGGSLNVYSGFA